MFSFKPILTTSILVSSVLIQQSAIAYPRASQRAEFNYLKSVLEIIYDRSSPELDNYLEEQYLSKSDSTENMLDKGYEMCNFVDLANKQGVSGKDLIAEEINNMTDLSLQRRGIQLEKEQARMLYENTMNHLCPELY